MSDQAVPRGRPTDYSDEIVETICVRLAQGEPLSSICRDSALPSSTTVYVWLHRYPDFQDKYARARRWQADTLADETLEIADDARNDWMLRNAGDGKEAWQVNGEHVQRSRLRIDQRKWLAGKLNPKKYGDKFVAEHVGPDGGPVQTITRIERHIVRAHPKDTDGSGL